MLARIDCRNRIDQIIVVILARVFPRGKQLGLWNDFQILEMM